MPFRKKIMKKYLLILVAGIMISGCGLNKQAKMVKALENCKYEIVSADSVIVAGKDVSSLIKNRKVSLDNMPGLALAYLRRDIPFRARVNLRVKNPGEERAAINRFEYKILIKGQELANGNVNQKVSVEPGGTTTVPVNVNGNIYQILSNGKTMQEIMDFLQGGKMAGTEKKGVVTLKIRPTIEVGSKLIQYPDYISIDKEVSSKILF